MAKRHQRDRGKERFWRQTLRQWRRSGLSVRDFCAQHHLAEPNFYAWRRAITQRDRQARQARTETHLTLPAATADFVPVCVLSEPAHVTLEIVLARGRVVRVTDGFDPATLRRVVEALEGASC